MNLEESERLLKQLEDDPSLEIPEGLEKAVAGNASLEKRLSETREQHETDRLLKAGFQKLRKELKNSEAVKINSSDLLERAMQNDKVDYSRKGRMLSLKKITAAVVVPAVAAMAVFLLRVEYEEKPPVSTAMNADSTEKQGNATEEKSAPAEEYVEQGGSATVSESPEKNYSEPELQPEKTIETSEPVADDNITREKKFSAAESPAISEEGDSPADETAELTERSAPMLGSMPEMRTEAELRKEADELFKKIKKNPEDSETEEKLRDILKKLNDKEGLAELDKITGK